MPFDNFDLSAVPVLKKNQLYELIFIHLALKNFGVLLKVRLFTIFTYIPGLLSFASSSSEELELLDSMSKFNLGRSSQNVRLTLYGLTFSFPPWVYELFEELDDLVGEEAETGIADAPIDHPSNLPGVKSGENDPGKMPREIVNIKEVFPQPFDPHTKILRSSL